jgi:hypothetical protein
MGVVSTTWAALLDFVLSIEDFLSIETLLLALGTEPTVP